MGLFKVNGDLSIDTSVVYVNGKQSDLSVCQISLAEYTALAKADQCEENTLYMVESDNCTAFGTKIQDVGEPELPTDAATKNYVDKNFARKDELSSIVQTEVRKLVSSLKITL